MVFLTQIGLQASMVAEGVLLGFFRGKVLLLGKNIALII